VLCQIIPTIEEEFGRECLGKDLYDWLKSDLVAIPASVKEWSASESYDEGAYVLRGECMFVSDLDCNRNDPNNDPSGTWLTANRFETECANEMWTKYVRQILACKSIIYTLEFSTFPIKAGGVTVLDGGSAYNSQGFRSANKGELNDVKTNMYSIINVLTKNMLHWAKQKVDDGLCTNMPLNDMLRCNGMCLTESQQARRRWAFG